MCNEKRRILAVNNETERTKVTRELRRRSKYSVITYYVMVLVMIMSVTGMNYTPVVYGKEIIKDTDKSNELKSPKNNEDTSGDIYINKESTMVEKATETEALPYNIQYIYDDMYEEDEIIIDDMYEEDEIIIDDMYEEDEIIIDDISAEEEEELTTDVEELNYRTTPNYDYEIISDSFGLYTDIHSSSGLTIEDIELLISDTGFSDCADTIFEMETLYGVNAYFTIAVASLESGYGSSYAAQTKNNLFGIMTSNGLRYFNSQSECIEYFGELISNYYIGYGLNCPVTINNKYCTGNEWSGKVVWIMNYYSNMI